MKKKTRDVGNAQFICEFWAQKIMKCFQKLSFACLWMIVWMNDNNTDVICKYHHMISSTNVCTSLKSWRWNLTKDKGWKSQGKCEFGSEKHFILGEKVIFICIGVFKKQRGMYEICTINSKQIFILYLNCSCNQNDDLLHNAKRLWDFKGYDIAKTSL